MHKYFLSSSKTFLFPRTFSFKSFLQKSYTILLLPSYFHRRIHCKKLCYRTVKKTFWSLRIKICRRLFTSSLSIVYSHLHQYTSRCINILWFKFNSRQPLSICFLYVQQWSACQFFKTRNSVESGEFRNIFFLFSHSQCCVRTIIF